jgi:hypothetical protein
MSISLSAGGTDVESEDEFGWGRDFGSSPETESRSAEVKRGAASLWAPDHSQLHELVPGARKRRES